MIPRLQLSALGSDELLGRKILKKLLFSKEGPTAPAIQAAFERKGNLLIPVSQGKKDWSNDGTITKQLSWHLTNLLIINLQNDRLNLCFNILKGFGSEKLLCLRWISAFMQQYTIFREQCSACTQNNLQRKIITK